MAAAGAGFGTEDIEGEAPATGKQKESPLRPMWRVPSRKAISRAPKQFIDVQNDQTSADVYLAVREGYRSIEHIKRYTAMGFGTDQGKLGNIHGRVRGSRFRSGAVPCRAQDTDAPVACRAWRAVRERG
jgi:sarcosine oxidase subunit alpha